MCLHEGLGAHQCCHGCIMAPDFWGQGPGLWAGQGRHPAQEMSVEHRTMRFTGKGICRGLSKVPRSPVLCGGAESLSPLFGSSHSLGSGFRVPKCLGISMGGGGTHTLCTPPALFSFLPYCLYSSISSPICSRGLSTVGSVGVWIQVGLAGGTTAQQVPEI